jgi:NAD(P)-dependent dehydrogenase (short-subunit alcohol dehydrogenase family)
MNGGNDRTPTIVVVGGAGGIGSEVVAQATARGWNCVAVGRTAEALQSVKVATGAETYVADARSDEAVDACMAHAVNRFGGVDGIVNCAGSLLLKPAHLTSESEWQDTLATNLTTAFYCVRAAAKHFGRDCGGSVVLCSSVAARVGLANHEAIAAAKAGVIGLTLSAAATYAARKIRVNCVAPGLVRTPLTARLVSNEASLKASTAMHPLGRIGEPGDVAAAIVWLLDPATSWVTGQVIGVDGGLSRVRHRTA